MQVYHVTVRLGYHNSKIDMIKSFRGSFRELNEYGEVVATLVGLKEAKEACESMMEGYRVEFSLTQGNIESLEHNGFIVDHQGRTIVPKRRVTVFIRDDGKKINAIKKLRACTGLGLKETKMMMDEMWGHNKPVELSVVNDKIIRDLTMIGFDVKGYILECFQGHEDLFEV